MNPRPAPHTYPSPIMFQFMGLTGYLHHGDYILWGGAGFQLEAALPALRAVIDVSGKPLPLGMGR